MVYHRLYTLSEVDGHFMSAEEIRAIDNGDAVRLARKTMNGRLMELWCGKCKVKSFPESLPGLKEIRTGAWIASGEPTHTAIQLTPR